MENSYFRDRLIFVSFSVGIALNIILWAVLMSKFGYSSQSVPLHFNVVYGVDFVRDSRMVYQIPAAGLAVFLVNIFLGRLAYRQELFFAYVLVIGQAAVQAILLIGGLAIIVLNR